MKIKFKELSTNRDFKQCIELQKSIFNLSEIESVSPLFLKLISRNSPPIGISYGLFNEEHVYSELIGFIIGFATFYEKSIYVVLIGIKPEYQNKKYGSLLLHKFRELALSRNIHSMSCVFDPLDSRLAMFYLTKLGCKGIKFINESEALNNYKIENDNILIHWDFDTVRPQNNFKSLNEKEFSELLNTNPLVSIDYMPDSSKVHLKIPTDFGNLKENEYDIAKMKQEIIRKILTEYINNRGYMATYFYSYNINNKSESFYLLEKL